MLLTQIRKIFWIDGREASLAEISSEIPKIEMHSSHQQFEIGGSGTGVDDVDENEVSLGFFQDVHGGRGDETGFAAAGRPADDHHVLFFIHTEVNDTTTTATAKNLLLLTSCG